jgi:hypothetical protein
MNYGFMNPYTKIKKYLTDSEFQKNRVLKKITTYTDYIPYINKLKLGYTDQITKGRPDYYITTTGTSGIPKIIPFHTNNKFTPSSAVIIPFLRPKILYNLLFGKICYFFRKEKEVLYNGTVCTNGITRQMLNVKNSFLMSWLVRKSSVSEFYQYVHEDEDYNVMGVHIINALRERNLRVIVGYFTRSVLEQFDTILANSEAFIHAIEIGEYVPKSGYVYKFIPDSARADELKKILNSQTATKGWVKKVWTKLDLIVCGASGAFKTYIPLIDYYTSGVEIYSPYCACTEMIYGINIYCRDNDLYCSDHKLGVIHTDNPDLLIDNKYTRLSISTVNGLDNYLIDDLLEINNNNRSFIYHGRYDFYQKIKFTEKVFTEKLISEFGENLRDYTIIAQNGKLNLCLCLGVGFVIKKTPSLDSLISLIPNLQITQVDKEFFSSIINMMAKRCCSREQLKIPRIINESHFLYDSLFIKK